MTAYGIAQIAGVIAGGLVVWIVGLWLVRKSDG